MSRATRERKSASIYGVHPGVAMVGKWIESLPEKTGRSLEQWLRLVKTKGPKTEAARREWLREEHGLGTNAAWWLAERAAGKGAEDEDPKAYLKVAAGYVEAMFAGRKSVLRPIYEEILTLAARLGGDVKACPCATIVPLYRKHVFAQIKPATLTRIDLGFALKDTKPVGRLVTTGGFAKKDRITHRIPLTSVSELDDEARRWLAAAYDLDA